MSERYKIVPGYYMRFRLLRWIGVPFLPFLGFWDCVSAEDDYNDLAERVRRVGGRLVNPTPLLPPSMTGEAQHEAEPQ